jgi:hypothetical protein
VQQLYLQLSNSISYNGRAYRRLHCIKLNNWKRLIKGTRFRLKTIRRWSSSFFEGLVGGPANITYGEKSSVVGMTKIALVWVIGLAAIFAIIFGFLGKFKAIVGSISNQVLGGVSLLLYKF